MGLCTGGATSLLICCYSVSCLHAGRVPQGIATRCQAEQPSTLSHFQSSLSLLFDYISSPCSNFFICFFFPLFSFCFVLPPFFSLMNPCQYFFPHSLALTFFFSSPSITSLSSTLLPNKKLSLLHVPTRHLLTQRPPSAGTGEGYTQTRTSRDSKPFGRSKCLLPNVLGNEELGKSFRDDTKKSKGPNKKARVVHTLYVIPLSPNATALVAR